jgi:hypothetical protein
MLSDGREERLLSLLDGKMQIVMPRGPRGARDEVRSRQGEPRVPPLGPRGMTIVVFLRTTERSLWPRDGIGANTLTTLMYARHWLRVDHCSDSRGDTPASARAYLS